MGRVVGIGGGVRLVVGGGLSLQDLPNGFESTVPLDSPESGCSRASKGRSGGFSLSLYRGHGLL